MELLVQNLSRLDEANSPEDFDGVHATFNVLENLADFRPASMCSLLCTRTGVLAYLVKRLRHPRKFDTNKQYAGELLSVLLQGGDGGNGRLLGELEGTDGVDELLQAIAYYRKREPTGEEEEELVENMFNVLLATLAGSKANRETFREKEGFELMVRCMKEKNHAGTCALRVLDVAIQDSPASAEAFVGAEGLKVLFPAFMGKGVVGVTGLTGAALATGASSSSSSSADPAKRRKMQRKALKKRIERRRERGRGGADEANELDEDQERAEGQAVALVSTLCTQLHAAAAAAAAGANQIQYIGHAPPTQHTEARGVYVVQPCECFHFFLTKE